MPSVYKRYTLNSPGDANWANIQNQLLKDMIDQITLNTAHREHREDDKPSGKPTKSSSKKDVIAERLAAINNSFNVEK
jgi:hypothetical protein